MDWLVKTVAWLIRAAERAYARKWVFLAFAFIVFVLSAVLLGLLGLLPDPKAEGASQAALQGSPLVSGVAFASTTVSVKELPVKIDIPAIDLSAKVANPETTDTVQLDNALLSGAVRYPASAQLGELGNVIVFAHSSYLPIVNNQAYKTFDGIQKLKKDERIIVSSEKSAYVYAVDTVSKASAESDAIPLAVSSPTLTLSTCNSFGTKSDRFVVTAHFVESYPLGS